jgi:hypothetical protein
MHYQHHYHHHHHHYHTDMMEQQMCAVGTHSIHSHTERAYCTTYMPAFVCRRIERGNEPSDCIKGDPLSDQQLVNRKYYLLSTAENKDWHILWGEKQEL